MEDLLIEQARDNSPAKFGPYFQRLLMPVDNWVLSELMDDWRLFCNRKVSAAEFQQLCEVSKTFVDNIREDDKHDIVWVECIIFITLQILSRRLAKPFVWTKYFDEATTIEADQLVINKIAQLYNKWQTIPLKKNQSAQPYAFYLLFKVIVTDKLITQKIVKFQVDQSIKDYLECFATGKSNFPNRLTDFAIDYFRNNNKLIENFDSSKFNNIEHFKRLDLSKAKNIDHLLKEDPEVRILMIGISGSGKSTVIKMIRHSLASTSDDKIGTDTTRIPITVLSPVTVDDTGTDEVDKTFGSVYKRTQGTGASSIEFPGEIAIDGRPFRMSFFDTRGGLLVKPTRKYDSNDNAMEGLVLEKLMSETDLLLVILDPETIFYPDDKYTFADILTFIISRLDYLFHKSKHAMIAFVFAKFDEYGSVIRGSRSLIHNTEQVRCLKNFMEAKPEDADKAWDELILEIGKAYGENTQLRQTICILLERIKYLLKVIYHHKEYPVVNCYIGSSAIFDNIQDSYWTGYPEVFNDFANYMEWLIKKKVELKIDSPSNLQASLNANVATLEWANQNKRALFSIVERKTDETDFKIIKESKSISPASKDNYTDNEVEYGKTYTYRIRFTDDAKDKNPGSYSNELVVTIPPKALAVILPPVDLEVAFKDGKIFIEWTNINNLPVLNRLERKEQGGEYKIIFDGRQVSKSTEMFSDIDVDYDKTYFYRLRTVDKADTSNYSIYTNEQNISTPKKIILAPTGIKEKIINGRISLSWKNENKYPVDAIVERKSIGAGRNYEQIYNDKVNAISTIDYLDKDVEFGKEYIYRFRFSTNGKEKENAMSNYIESNSLKTIPNGIRQLKYELKPNSDSPEFVELTWDEPQNAYKVVYSIFRKLINTPAGSNATQKLAANITGNSYRDATIVRGCSYIYELVVSEDVRGGYFLPPVPTGEVKIKKSNTETWIVIIIIIVVLVILVLWAFWDAITGPGASPTIN